MTSWADSTDFDKTIAGARDGREECFGTLWRALQPPLLGWLRIVAPGFEEEVAADTWVSVTQGLHRFSGDYSDFRSWLFTIARRRAVDQYRSRMRHPEPVDIHQHDPVADRDDPSIQVTESLASRQAVAVLQKLPPNQRQVVALRVVAGLSVTETARTLGKSEGAVRVLCHRGLQSLAGIVGQHEGALV